MLKVFRSKNLELFRRPDLRSMGKTCHDAACNQTLLIDAASTASDSQRATKLPQSNLRCWFQSRVIFSMTVCPVVALSVCLLPVQEGSRFWLRNVGWILEARDHAN